MDPLSMLGIGNAVGGIFGTLFGGKRRLSAEQQAMANAIHPVDATYAISPEAKQQLGLAQQQYNGAMPGATTEQNNIFTNQSNTNANAEHNATSGAQALAVEAAAQGQTNSALSNLAVQTEQNKQQQFGNVAAAQNNMSNQEYQQYQDQVRKFNNDTAAKAALQSASIQNKMSWNNDLSSTVGSILGSEAQSAVYNKALKSGLPGQEQAQDNKTTLLSLLQTIFQSKGTRLPGSLPGSVQTIPFNPNINNAGLQPNYAPSI